mgnify:CR=1 FL=1
MKLKRDFKSLNTINLDLSEEINDAVKLIAKDIKNGIQSKAQFGKGFKPNAQATEDGKGFNHPLKNTGLMMDNAKMQISKATKSKLEGTLQPNSKRIDVGFYNQEGTNRIPSRPWFGVSEAAERKILTSMREKIKREVDKL